MSGFFSFGEGAPVMHREFMGFAADEESQVILRGWAERQGYPPAAIQLGGPEMFAQMMEADAPPRMALIDIDGQVDPAATLARLASLCGSECRLIAMGGLNDVGLFRRVLDAGAVDYLVKPLTPEMLNHALAAALRGGPRKSEAQEARIAVFIGARGGVGTSAAALNAAWIAAHELKRNTVFFDLDLQFGTSSLALDLDPGRGLRDIVGSPHRVDGLMIASSIVPESDTFSVLAAEEAIDEMIPMDAGAISALLKEMSGNFDLVVVDLPRHLMAAHKRLISAAHDIVIVSDMTLAGIRDTLRLKNAVTATGTAARIACVAARVDANGAGQIDKSAFEKGIQGKIDFVVPEDKPALATAANAGKALGEVAPKSAATKVLRDLAVRIAGNAEPPPPKLSFLAKLLKKPGRGA